MLPSMLDIAGTRRPEARYRNAAIGEKFSGGDPASELGDIQHFIKVSSFNPPEEIAESVNRALRLKQQIYFYPTVLKLLLRPPLSLQVTGRHTATFFRRKHLEKRNAIVVKHHQ